MAIARSDPTVWFAFIESFAKVLSGRDRELPALIAWEKPDSLAEQAERSPEATSRTCPGH